MFKDSLCYYTILEITSDPKLQLILMMIFGALLFLALYVFLDNKFSPKHPKFANLLAGFYYKRSQPPR